MIGFCPLASGSRGNAIYLGSKNTKILVDVGLSLKELTSRLSQINVDVADLDAILITHEHIDHIKGLLVTCRKLGIPVFANKETAKAVMEFFREDAKGFIPKFRIFSSDETFQYGDIQIHPFSIQHDAIEPVAFTCVVDSLKVGICADLGFASSLVLHHLQGCDYLYLEANHEPSMVHACSRPMVYKQRVLSRQGHLSNAESAAVLSQVYHDNLKRVYLAHLSSECNNPQTAIQTVQGVLESQQKELALAIAMQDVVSEPVFFT